MTERASPRRNQILRTPSGTVTGGIIIYESGNQQRAAIAQMLVCATLWSSAGIFIKLIDLSPFAIAGFRGLLAAVTVAVYMLVTRQKLIVSKNVLLSMFFLSGTFLCFVTANKLTTAANAIVLQFTAPIFIVLFSALFFRQKYGKADVLLVALAVLGISVFFVGSLQPGQLSGNLVGLLAGVFMAGMYLSVGKTAGEEKMSAILFGQLLTAVIGIPFFFFTKGTLTPISAVYLLILGVFQIGVPYILLALASKSCPPLACCLIAAVEPVLNPVWVLLFSGERPGCFRFWAASSSSGPLPLSAFCRTNEAG